MINKLIMTPGPTQVTENVRMARSLPSTNPDLDPAFYDFYKETCEKLSTQMHTTNPFYILSGEGILGLEAACASLTEPGDKVLVISNGIFGFGFADFVAMYGGLPTIYEDSLVNEIDIDKLAAYLKSNHDFKYATIVHCDTPSGVLNDISKICPLLKSYGILTVVDAVASMFGHDINIEESQLDLICGATQKALSAPVGLTVIGVSPDAIYAMENRKTPIASFYCNLLNFKDYYRNKWFPYSMPASDINGLAVALDNVFQDTNSIMRHKKIAKATRKTLVRCGLELHLESGYADTVSVFNVPSITTGEDILERMRVKHNILIAGSFGYLDGKVIRLGHMGENCTYDNMEKTLTALGETLNYLGVSLNEKLEVAFKDFFTRS